MNMEKNIYIRVLKFGNLHPNGFNLIEIRDNKTLGLSITEKKVVEEYIQNAYINTQKYSASGYPDHKTLFLCIERGRDYMDKKTKFTINLDSQFKYIDYLELKEARKMAKSANANAAKAHIQAMASHKTAKWAVFAAIIIPLIASWKDLLELFGYICKCF